MYSENSKCFKCWGLRRPFQAWDSKGRKWSNATDLCTSEAMTALFTMKKRALEIGSRREVGNEEVLVQSYSVLPWQGERPMRSRDLVEREKAHNSFVCVKKYVCKRKYQKNGPQILTWFSPGGRIRGDFNFLFYVCMFCLNILIMCMLWLS